MMSKDDLIENITFAKRLVHEFSKKPFIDLNLNFWFSTERNIKFSVTKEDKGLPYLDFFDVIIFKDDVIEITDFFYSIRDLLVERKIPDKIRKELLKEEFWRDKKKIADLKLRYPDILDAHYQKTRIIEKLSKELIIPNMKIKNVINEEGISVTNIILEHIKYDLETINRIISALEFLKEIYKTLYSLGDSVFIEEDDRERQLNELLKFLNIAADITLATSDRSKIISLYVHPLYNLNELIIEIHFYKDKKKLMITLSKKEKNVFETQTFSDNKWSSEEFKTLNKAIEAIKNTLKN